MNRSLYKDKVPPDFEKELTQKIIGAAMEVHKELGPGLLENVYQVCLAREFALQKLAFAQEQVLPIIYKGFQVENQYRADFIVENKVVVELKAVEGVLPVHEAQLLTYMRLANCRVGLLLNFNVAVLKHGVTRRVL